MTARYTNKSDISLSVAVWLATDTYDHNNDPWTISVTSLLKPTKQIILSGRVRTNTQQEDIEGLVNSRMGTAFHDSVERAWTSNFKQALVDLGYPPAVIQRVKVNPDPDTLTPDDIPVYLEQRSSKKVGKWTISGKYDFVADGFLEDFKSTGVYTFITQSKYEDYQYQGSIYRWLNPDIIYQPYMRIQYLFTDWSKLRYLQEKHKGYPDKRLKTQKIPLLSLDETERFITGKLNQIERLLDAPEEQIPACTPKELWMDDPVYKYYKDPNKTDGRSTKNFTSQEEASARLAEDGFKGIVIKVQGQAKACRYCPAFDICKQKDQLIADNLLKLD